MADIHDFYTDLSPEAQAVMVAALEAKGASQPFFKALPPEARQAFQDQRRAAYAHAAVRAAGDIAAHPAAVVAGAGRGLRR
jgi:hypothetical protein